MNTVVYRVTRLNLAIDLWTAQSELVGNFGILWSWSGRRYKIVGWSWSVLAREFFLVRLQEQSVRVRESLNLAMDCDSQHALVHHLKSMAYLTLHEHFWTVIINW